MKSHVDTSKKSDIRTDRKFDSQQRYMDKYPYEKTSEVGIERGYDKNTASRVSPSVSR